MPGGGPPTPDRSLGRRSTLPAGRAIVGATLVVVAAVLTFVGYVLATAQPTQTYLVPVKDLAPNQPLNPSQFRTVSGDLPAEVRRSAITTFDQLKDAVPVTALGSGTLLTTANFVRTNGAGARYEVPFTVPLWKLNGANPGDTIVLVPTADRNGSRAGTPLPVRIISLSPTGGSNGDWIVSAAADSNDAVRNVVEVVKAGEFWIARDTAPGGGPAVGGGSVTAGPLGGANGSPNPADAPTTSAAPLAPPAPPATSAPPPPRKP
jgi:hypothetical protein